jgi:hypothetical protein
LANAQSAANVAAIQESAKLNRINQITPFGTVNWTTTGASAPAAAPSSWTQQGTDWVDQYGNIVSGASGTQQRTLNKMGQITTPTGNVSSGPPSVVYYGPNKLTTPGASGTGIPNTQVTELSPSGQTQLGYQNQIAEGLLGRGVEMLNNLDTSPFSLSGIPQLPDQSDLQAAGKRVSDALYGQATSRLDPYWNQQSTNEDTQLINRGIYQGSEAYNKAMDDLARQRTDAYQTALNNSIAAGGAEQSRQFGLAQAGQQQAISNLLLQRTQPMNELAALIQGSPAFSVPTAQPAPAVPTIPTDVIGPAQLNYQGQLNAYNAALQNQSNTLSGLFGLGGAILGIPGLF